MIEKEELKKRIRKSGDFGSTNALAIIDAIFELKKSVDKLKLVNNIIVKPDKNISKAIKEFSKQIKYLHFELEEIRESSDKEDEK